MKASWDFQVVLHVPLFATEYQSSKQPAVSTILPPLGHSFASQMLFPSA